MIINISAEKDKNSNLQWKIPILYFNQSINYKVCVHLVHTMLAQSTVKLLENNDLLHLTTNLIDQSSRNQDSSIVFLNYKLLYGQRQTWRIQAPIYIPLQLFELENSSFTLKHVFGEKELLFEKIFIQLEILREDSHARILKVN